MDELEKRTNAARFGLEWFRALAFKQHTHAKPSDSTNLLSFGLAGMTQAMAPEFTSALPCVIALLCFWMLSICV